MIMNNGAQRSCDAELTCVNNGGVYNVLESTCTLGNVSYSNEDVCGWATSGLPSEQSGNGASSWLSAISSFDFGIFSNAYCNLYPLLNSGNVPPECKPKPINGESVEDTGTSGKYILAIVLVIVVAVIAFFVIKKYRK